MAQTPDLSVIEGLTRGISQACKERGSMVSDMLVTFMVRSLLLKPREAERSLSTEDIETFIESCVEKLVAKNSPSLDTLKMQLFFNTNYTSRTAFLDQIHSMLESRLSSLSREITDIRVKSGYELDALYCRITTYVLVRSAMGSPTDIADIEEATAALQSIFPKIKLGSFMVLLKEEKEEVLKEFTLTVTGIRLFNRAIKEREDQLDVKKLMPETLTKVLPSTIEMIRRELETTQNLVWRYTAALERLTDPKNASEQIGVPLDQLRQSLYNVRQHQVFLKILLTDAILCARDVEGLQIEMNSQLTLLGQKVRPRTAVPTAVVSPIFKILSKVWFAIQDAAELLEILGNITFSFQPFLSSQAKIFSKNYLDTLLDDTVVKTDDERREESSANQVDPSKLNTQDWLMPETTSSFNELPLQFNGFCPHVLIKRNGLLLLGNPNIGVLKYKEKLYAFSSKQGALEFASKPDYFLAEVAEKNKQFPELFELLQLHQQFTRITPPREKPAEEEEEDDTLMGAIIKCEIGCQTIVHPIESHIDKSYEWNEWELRRKAIKLTDLRTKRTHSAQADLSHMRRENVSQTWPPKDSWSQTKREKEANMPTPMVYLAGLRGERDGEFIKTDLTKSVAEH